MKSEQLLQLARIYQENESFITNEETAKMSLVVPFIRLLGYDPNLPREVRLEYTAEFTQGDGKRLPDRMDFVVFDRMGKGDRFIFCRGHCNNSTGWPNMALAVGPLASLADAEEHRWVMALVDGDEPWQKLIGSKKRSDGSR